MNKSEHFCVQLILKALRKGIEVLLSYSEKERAQLQLETDFTFNFDALLYDVFDLLNDELSELTIEALQSQFFIYFCGNNERLATKNHILPKMDKIIELLKFMVQEFCQRADKEKMMTFQEFLSFQKSEIQNFLQNKSKHSSDLLDLRKLMHELSNSFHDSYMSIHTKEINFEQIFLARLLVFLFGFQIHQKSFCHSRKRPQLLLHQAIMENKLSMVQKLCSGQVIDMPSGEFIYWQDVNEIDPLGNSPLMLAYRLKRIECIRILCDHVVNPKFRPFPDYPSPYDLALNQKDREVLKLFIEANQKSKQAYLEETKEEIFELLETIPDFSLKMSFQCESNLIPFLKNFTPHDTFRIYKGGTNLRLDFTPRTFKQTLNLKDQPASPQSQNYSPDQQQKKVSSSCFIFKGRDDQQKENEAELLFVDSQNLQCFNVLTDMYSGRLDEEVTKLLKKKEKVKEIDQKKSSLNLQEIRDWRGNIQLKSIDGFKCQKLKAKGQVCIQNTTYTMGSIYNPIYSLDFTNGKFSSYLERAKTDQDSILMLDQELLELEKDDIFVMGYVLKKQYISNQLQIQVEKKIQVNQKSRVQKFQNYMVSDEGCQKMDSLMLMGSQSSRSNSRRRTSSNFREATKVKMETKSVSATIWSTEEFPISLSFLKPILRILSFASKNISKFHSFLSSQQIPDNQFPLQASIPLFFSVKANINFHDFKFENFKLDKHYKKLFYSDQEVQEMLKQKRIEELKKFQNSPRFNEDPIIEEYQSEDSILSAQNKYLNLKDSCQKEDNSPKNANPSILYTESEQKDMNERSNQSFLIAQLKNPVEMKSIKGLNKQKIPNMSKPLVFSDLTRQLAKKSQDQQPIKLVNIKKQKSQQVPNQKLKGPQQSHLTKEYFKSSKLQEKPSIEPIQTDGTEVMFFKESKTPVNYMSPRVQKSMIKDSQDFIETQIIQPKLDKAGITRTLEMLEEQKSTFYRSQRGGFENQEDREGLKLQVEHNCELNSVVNDFSLIRSGKKDTPFMAFDRLSPLNSQSVKNSQNYQTHNPKRFLFQDQKSPQSLFDSPTKIQPDSGSKQVPIIGKYKKHNALSPVQQQQQNQPLFYRTLDQMQMRNGFLQQTQEFAKMAVSGLFQGKKQ